jgi:hypothetical protein
LSCAIILALSRALAISLIILMQDIQYGSITGQYTPLIKCMKHGTTKTVEMNIICVVL